MMSTLEKIRKEALVRRNSIKRICKEGCSVAGHWRRYGNERIWIEAHERSGYQVILDSGQRV